MGNKIAMFTVYVYDMEYDDSLTSFLHSFNPRTCFVPQTI